MSFRKSTAYTKATMMMMMANHQSPSIAVVTGGRSGIGLAIARKIASFPFIERVLAVSRSITDHDVAHISPKIQAVQADVATVEGRQAIVQEVSKLCGGGGGKTTRTKQLRFLIHSAGIIDPIKPILQVTPEELRYAMTVNCEAPFFLTTALYPFMTPLEDSSTGIAGRVLHVSSGAAHGAPPTGWSVYGITKAAFFQSYRVLEREFREALGGKVVVSSFKPGVVDTDMQGLIRDTPAQSMPLVDKFKEMKNKAAATSSSIDDKARPPPPGALDTSNNVAHFAEFLLLGTSDEEFGNKDSSTEYDIRDKELYPRWIAAEDLE